MKKFILFVSLICLYFVVDASDEQLFQALKENNIAQLKSLLADGGNSSAYDSSGYTLLHWAVLANNKAAIELLLKSNANINSPGVYIALSTCPLPKYYTEETMQKLAKHVSFVQPNYDNSSYGIFINKKLNTIGMVHYHIHKPCNLVASNILTLNEKILLEEINYNFYNHSTTTVFQNLTPLHWALLSQSVDTIKLLMSHQANGLALCDKEYDDCKIVTMQQWVEQFSNSQLFSLINTSIDEATQYPLLLTKLAYKETLQDNKPTSVKSVRPKRLPKQKVPKVSPVNVLLSQGMAANDISRVKKALDLGVNTNIHFSDGSTALHKAIEFKNIQLVKLLLSYKADPNVKDYQGDAPLHRVIKLVTLPNNHPITMQALIDIVKLLLCNGAEVDAKNAQNHTPLADMLIDDTKKLTIPARQEMDFFFKVSKCTPELLLLLLKYGADFNVNKSILLQAAYTLNCMVLKELLLDHGAFSDALTRQVNSSVKDVYKNHINKAIYEGDIDKAVAILHIMPSFFQGLEPSSLGEYSTIKFGPKSSSYKALSLALSAYWQKLVKVVQKNDVASLRELLKKGFPLTICDELGDSLLHKAAQSHATKAFLFILNLRPDFINKKNKAGFVPSDLVSK